jgi:hypothetical protein
LARIDLSIFSISFSLVLVFHSSARRNIRDYTIFSPCLRPTFTLMLKVP